jgi:hypothetical protein
MKLSPATMRFVEVSLAALLSSTVEASTNTKTTKLKEKS